MHVVVADDIVIRLCRAIVPRPADADPMGVKVGYLAVLYQVVASLLDHDTPSPREHAAAMNDCRVADARKRSAVRSVVQRLPSTDSNPRATDIVYERVPYCSIDRTTFYPDAILSDMFYCHAIDRAVRGVRQLQRSARQETRFLYRAACFVRGHAVAHRAKAPVRVVERDVGHRDMAGAVQKQQRARRHTRHERQRTRVLALVAGLPQERARRLVEEPLIFAVAGLRCTATYQICTEKK